MANYKRYALLFISFRVQLRILPLVQASADFGALYWFILKRKWFGTFPLFLLVTIIVESR